MKTILYLFSLLFLNTITLSAQQFETSKDEDISTSTADCYGETVTYEYASHWLSPNLDTAKLMDTTYLQDVITFINSKNSQIRGFYIDTSLRRNSYNFLVRKGIPIEIRSEDYTAIGSLNIRLSDTMDAQTYNTVFANSNLFLFIDYHPVGHTQAVPGEPIFLRINRITTKLIRTNSN